MTNRRIPFSEARQNFTSIVDEVEKFGRAGTIVRRGKRAKSLFERAEEERALIYVPSVVLWELADQLRLGTLRLRQRFDHWCRALGSKQGFQIQPLLWEDVNEARGLPFDDPFDCLIAGTALRIGVP